MIIPFKSMPMCLKIAPRRTTMAAMGYTDRQFQAQASHSMTAELHRTQLKSAVSDIKYIIRKSVS
jgi:hypothetical protein